MKKRATRDGDEQLQPVLVGADLISDRALAREDPDEFGHEQIALQVATLVSDGEDRTNVALFGAWGSGKSSMCELIERHLPKDVRLIRYDAWKSGGEALRRNFISHAATKLGFTEAKSPAKYRKFHRGLYESRSTTDLSLSELLKSEGLFLAEWAVLATLLVTVVVVLGVAGLLTWVGAGSFTTQLRFALQRVLPFLWPALGAIVAFFRLASLAKVDVQRTAPSADEEFSRTFGELVAEATSSGVLGSGLRRLVFFVDELDRCGKEDVVATLVALKTFLDQPRCVFVVAADREVLEEALDELPQSTPVRELEPYYSSASAFLDKIFQHQIALPPLRGQRLTRFARDLVSNEGGLWAELTQERADAVNLDRLMSALIPSHVRSPRRVKVLLNNFATTARIAQSRGIDWESRAQEIAKLTVLRTEFPGLARDLHLLPTLPTMLLHRPANPSPRVADLLARHALATDTPTGALPPTGPADETVGAPAAEAPTDSTAEVPEEPDRLLVAEDESTGLREKARLARQQRNDLRLYLKRMESAGVGDPGRDLLFLEPAGAPAGFADELLGQRIEDEAADDVSGVASAIIASTTPDKLASIRMLADLSEREIGEEQANLVAILCRVAADLREEGESEAPIAAQALRGFLADYALRRGDGLGAIWIGVLAGEPEVARAGFKDATVLDDPSDLRSLWQLLPQLDEQNADRLRHALGRTAALDDSPLVEALRGLDSEQATQLVAESMDDVVEQLAAPADEEHDAQGRALAILDLLLERELIVAAEQAYAALAASTAQPLYGAAWSRAEQLLPQLSPETRNKHALQSLVECKPGGWLKWAAFLVADAPATPADLAVQAIDAVVSRWGEATPEQQDSAPDLVVRIAATGSDVTQPAAFTSPSGALGALLAPSAWPTDPVALDRVARLWTLADRLVAVGAVDLGVIESLITADVARVIPPAAPLQAAVAQALARLAQTLPPGPVHSIVAAADGLQEPWALPLRLALRLRAARLNLEDIAPVPVSDVVETVSQRAGTAPESVTLWLATEPGYADVRSVLTAGAPESDVVQTALADWARRGSVADRTSLWLALSDPSRHAVWRRLLSDCGVDQTTIVADLAAGMRAASTATARANVAALLCELAPDGLEARVLIDLAVELLGSDLKKDVETAGRLVLAADVRFRVGELKRLFRDAADAGRAPDGGLRKDLEEGGWLPKKPKRRSRFNPFGG